MFTCIYSFNVCKLAYLGIQFKLNSTTGLVKKLNCDFFFTIVIKGCYVVVY